MTTTEKTYSSKDFFQALRKAADDEDFDALSGVLGGGTGGVYGTVVEQAVSAGDLKDAICKNLGGIIRVSDSIIADPTATAKDVAWAKDKKSKAQDDQKKQNCPPPANA